MKEILEQLLKRYTDIFYQDCSDERKLATKTRTNHAITGWKDYSTLRDVNYKPNKIDLKNL
jgi:hypothetical protein